MQLNPSRREFLVVGTAAMLASRPPKSRAADEVDPRVAEIVAGTIGIDTHNHIDVPMTAGELPGPDLDLSAELKRSGLTAICATFAVDRQRLGAPGVAYERFQNALQVLDTQLTRNQLRRALNLADIRQAREQNRPTVIQAVEGGHFLEGKLERLEEAYNRGLRVLGLLHDNDAIPPLGDLYTQPAHLGGLTDLGVSVIKECERLGILVDLTHASTATVVAALRVATKPVFFSHTGLDTRLGSNERMGQMMRPRLISQEHARTIASAGGLVGVWTHLVETPVEYAQAIRAMIDVIGVEHVCIGTDTKLVPGADPGGPGGPTQKKVGDAPQKKAGGLGGSRMGATTNQPWADQKVGFYHAVVAALLNQGFTPAEIGKIGGGNFCRVFDAATSRQS